MPSTYKNRTYKNRFDRRTHVVDQTANRLVILGLIRLIVVVFDGAR